MIIETDLGNDPDDLFAILWLIAIGQKIDGIVITPGSKHQILIANLIIEECGLDIPIGVFSYRENNQYGRIYKELIKKYKFDICHYIDSKEIISNYTKDVLIIGPPKNIRYGSKFSRITFQGGFCPYSIYKPQITLDKFIDKEYQPSFNPGGDKNTTHRIINKEFSNNLTFCGKNVCHSILYDKEIHKNIKPHNKASFLFKEIMDHYLKIKECKAFHDPIAACMHVDPSIGVWYNGTPEYLNGSWTTKPGDCNILVDLDRKLFWEKILNF